MGRANATRAGENDRALRSEIPTMADSLWYPSVGDVIDIHDAIVSEYSDTTPGIQNQGDIDFALATVSDGGHELVSGTIHEKAFQLLRLLVANHPFVDGNKRTALNTTAVFYLLNGYRFDYDDEVREILKEFGTDATAVDEEYVVEYLRTNTSPVDVNGVIAQWQGELVEYGLEQLSDEQSDPNG